MALYFCPSETAKYSRTYFERKESEGQFCVPTEIRGAVVESKGVNHTLSRIMGFRACDT
jgi:hypothetical protein